MPMFPNYQEQWTWWRWLATRKSRTHSMTLKGHSGQWNSWYKAKRELGQMTTNIKLTIATKAKGRHQSLDFCFSYKEAPPLYSWNAKHKQWQAKTSRTMPRPWPSSNTMIVSKAVAMMRYNDRVFPIFTVLTRLGYLQWLTVCLHLA
jgi:hypothetical protein